MDAPEQDSAAAAAAATSSIRVQVKHGPQLLQIDVLSSATVADLMAALQASTGIAPRGQKLIHKGRILDPKDALSAASVGAGAKLMLMATPGVRQGGGGGTGGGCGPGRQRPALASGGAREEGPEERQPPIGARAAQPAPGLAKTRAENWRKMGIVALRDEGLEEVPALVWEAGPSIRVLDLSGNRLPALPPAAAALAGLQRLQLSRNLLTEDAVPWQALRQLSRLSALAMDHNRLTAVPPGLCKLRALRRLSLAGNAIRSLPEAFGELRALEWLDISHNRLSALGDELARCCCLEELNLASNSLRTVPTSLAELRKLKVLVLDNNALSTFPGEVLRRCAELATLGLHGNELTVEDLRQVDGWPAFDERRRRKLDKQLGGGAMGAAAGFDEGADAHLWRRW